MVDPTPHAHNHTFVKRLMLLMLSWYSAVCPGAVSAPCSHRGKCDDGHLGNGTCACDTGFSGVACELCSPGFYGVTCRGVLHTITLTLVSQLENISISCKNTANIINI